MSLLLDARKKSQQALSAHGADGGRSRNELSLEEHTKSGPAKPGPDSASSSPEDKARSAGKNLFGAKSPVASLASGSGINRNLLLALGGTLILIIGGGGYLWYVDSATSSQPIITRAPFTAAPVPAPAPPQKTVVAEAAAPASADGAQQAKLASDAQHATKKPVPQSGARIRLKPQQTDLIDPLIGNAYLAYRSGKLGEARQMYLEVLGKDAQNIDALLGLAAISQQLGEDGFATQYYLRVLTMDPRNAVANAGMSALSMDENSESRLKNLLREQRDSAALHSALGNIYAGQSRWAEAQSSYFNAYTLDSKNAELALNLAVSLDHQGQPKLAAQYYQRALDLAGGNPPRGFDHAQISQRVQELTR